MRYWDVFHSDRLEAERSLTTEAVRNALARGELRPNDLVRRSGETGWTRIGESADFGAIRMATVEIEPEPVEKVSPPPPVAAEFASPSIEQEFEVVIDDRGESGFEIDPDAFASIDRDELLRAETEADAEEEEFEFIPEPEPESKREKKPESSAFPRQASSAMAMPVLEDEETERPDLDELNDPIPDIDFEEFDPQDEDEAAAEFTLSRNRAETVEELDLAAMVDVAFQLVLFFLVTAQVVLFKTLEIPRPNEEKPPEAAAQSRAKSLDELKDDHILVEVDAAGNIKIDRQPVSGLRSELIEKLRKSREETHRKVMLLSADFATHHENAVKVIDVANEIDLPIKLAQPAAKK
jgi:biopolymer transport protein ExbD